MVSVSGVLLLLGLFAFAGADSAFMKAFNPVVRPESAFTKGNVRFSVLTPAIVRMEYSAHGAFDDTATLAFLHRHMPAVDVAIEETADTFRLTTSHVSIEYKLTDAAGPEGLSPARLSATLQVHPRSAWTPGMPPSANLHGTIRTLDRVGDPVNLACPPVADFYVYYSHCEEGLVSRDGWVLVDDTFRPRVERDAGGTPWPRGPPPAAAKGDGSYVDWYLFAHGHDYKLALKEFTQLSGPIPLAPRYALGPAFSRWFQWSDIENLEIVQSGFADNGIPLDVLVVDMDW